MACKKRTVPPSKQSSSQKRFKAAAKATATKCFSASNTPAEFHKCRGAAMKVALKGKGKSKATATKGKATALTGKSKACVGLVKSGSKKGRLKKGYRWKKGGGCPVKVAA